MLRLRQRLVTRQVRRVARLAPEKVYPSGFSTGVTIERAALRTVIVTSESLETTVAIPGDTLSYYATVFDNLGEPLPVTFTARLMLDTTLLVAFSFATDVYDSVTGSLALAFTFPDVAEGTYTVYIEWDRQRTE